jgi:hypothetical protein
MREAASLDPDLAQPSRGSAPIGSDHVGGKRISSFCSRWPTSRIGWRMLPKTGRWVNDASQD